VSIASSVDGWVDPAFSSCLEAFRENFAADGELGAACAIYLHGEPVLDAWGGIAVARRNTPWTEDTVAPVFSVTKGIAALCVLSLASNDRFGLQQPVAQHWPAFGAHGKSNVSIAEALGHRAGVPAITRPITLEDLANPQEMSSRIAAEKPLFEPGTAHFYHALTIGWITTELVRRATGQQVGEWFREHLAEPLGLSIQIGRNAIDETPIAEVEVPPEHDSTALDPFSFPGTVLSLNGLFIPSMSGLAAAMNDPAVQRLELAGANAMADARSLAKLYSEALTGTCGKPLLSPACIEEATTIVSEGPQWGMELPGPTWGAGLMLPWHVQPMLGPGSFGHDGAGGSLAFAHAPSGVSFAYVRNRAGPPNVADPLVYRVVEALADCLNLRVPKP